MNIKIIKFKNKIKLKMKLKKMERYDSLKHKTNP